MEKIRTFTTHGIQEEIVYNINDFPYYDTYLRAGTVRKKGKRNITYYNIPCAFDIETTTIEEKDNVSRETLNAYAFMYQWQFCVIDKVVFGRTWKEFIIFLSKLRETFGLCDSVRLPVYIHNLPYEFQFMNRFIQIDNIFATDVRKPLKVESDGIEFRCSFKLSNMSLLKFCENSSECVHRKIKDMDNGSEFPEYDYHIKRTPKTTLTNAEKAYCYNDVRGLCECLISILNDNNDDMSTIPLTNTGYVRRDFRKAMNKPYLRKRFKKTALTLSQYQLLKDAFRGGNTHANRYYSGSIIPDVFSYDIQSSYPAVMMMDYFPVGKFTDIIFESKEELEEYCEKYCVVFKLRLFNLSVKNNNPVPYIPVSKCLKYSKENILIDNGRVLTADYVELAVTEIDYKIIKETYDYDEFYVHSAIYTKRGKLPDEFRSRLLYWYDKKTSLKGEDDFLYEYIKSKNRVNSSFGMMVSAIIHEDFLFNGKEWDRSETGKSQEEKLNDYYDSYNSFLSYQHGVYVTAHARCRLQKMINKVGNDLIYVDTDSIKFINAHHIHEFEQLNRHLIFEAENNDIQAYAEKGGKKYFLGIWDREHDYIRFKTLGAKKYCDEFYDKKGKKKFEITVAGMSKELGAKEVGTIENFEIGKTYSNVGRTVSYYNDDDIHVLRIGDEEIVTASNVGIVESTYTLGVTFEYWEIIFKNVLTKKRVM